MTTRHCPHCDNENEPLGKLGRITYYRCRQCGAQYYTQQKPSKKTRHAKAV